MPLTVGTRIGPYEVVAPIGRGGMGEVYEARDTRLDRTVAIKALPAHLSSDAHRRERLGREARAVSSLQHPHICTLFDVGNEDGTMYLVMEYLEGETLQERLSRGGLSLDEALRYGSEIADALTAAHEKNIVHRDLKPGNVMLTVTGVKLLDFGLAKLQRDEKGGTLDSDSPTEHRPLTEEGSLLGTIPYMAPEQLEGKEADARADIFAFGAVLYEMVTGKRAFEASSQASLIAAIMSGEPRSVRELRPKSPPLLERILSKCLAKASEDRFQSARDLKSALEWAREPMVDAGPPPSPPRRLERLGWPMALLTTLALVGIALWNREQVPAAFTLRTVVTLPEGQALRFTSDGNAFAVSPDGRRIALVAFDPTRGFGRLFLRDLTSYETDPLTDLTNSIGQPFFSADGREIGYVSARALYKVSIAGGAPSEIARPNHAPIGLTWMEDGGIVYGTRTGLWRLSEAGGDAEPLTELGEGESYHGEPQALPGGRGVLFTMAASGPSIAVLPAGTTEARILTAGRSGFFLESGHLIFVSAENGSVLAAPFDLESLELTGTPIPISDRVGRPGGPARPYAPIAAGREGTLAYLHDIQTPARTVWVSRDGAVTPVVDEAFHSVRLSPDGSRFAADDNEAGRSLVYDLARGTRVLVADASGVQLPWRPDGSEVAYASLREGVLASSADGSQRGRLLVEGEALIPSSWSPDGRFLAITGGPAENAEILIFSVEGELTPFVSSAAHEEAAAFSPDGKWIAYQSDETGRPEIYVSPFPGPGARVPISTNGGKAPVWSRDGRELFYREGSAMMAVAFTSTDTTFTAERPVHLFDGPFLADGTGHPSYDVAPDGRFLMMYSAAGPSTELRVVVNLAEELLDLEASR